VLEHVPDVVSVGFALLGGIYWITNRRDRVASAENAEAAETTETTADTSDEKE
jgi:hypothetical protein